MDRASGILRNAILLDCVLNILEEQNVVSSFYLQMMPHLHQGSLQGQKTQFPGPLCTECQHTVVAPQHNCKCFNTPFIKRGGGFCPLLWNLSQAVTVEDTEYREEMLLDLGG